jgi:LuxR family transcriptional regulator, maltose regulon positive regulatory protein
MLDEGREHKPAICVVGPPGAGKTTLVASWLDARGIKGIWYQVDAGDADLATFFYYLGEAAKPFARKGQPALPALTPEYLSDAEGFSRRYFRELFSRLAEGAALVLDNYQEVGPTHPFHALVSQAVDEMPRGMTLIAVSRRDPPECYARLIANENVKLLEWDALKLILDEARAIAGARAELSEENMRQLHEQSGGWAAGLTLLLESRDRLTGSLGAMEKVFDYFATQIFDAASGPTQRFLMETALLTNIPVSLASELTGNPDAQTILEDLYRRHMFTHRKPGSQAIYSYHALFRSFLRERGRQLIGAAERQEYTRRAAQLLSAGGEHQDAFTLYCEVADWDAASRLALRQASALLALGRLQTLKEWILQLPPASMEKEPWLGYWLGNALIPISHREARAQFEAAFALFAARGDTLGQAMSASAVIDTIYFEWSQFQPFTRWIDILAGLLDKLSFGDRIDHELRAYSSFLIGALFVAPGHEMLPSCVERVTGLLDENLNFNSRIHVASHLLAYCGTARDMYRARRIEAKVDPLSGHDSVTPLNRMRWDLRVGQSHTFQGQYDSGDQRLRAAADTAVSHGLEGLRTSALLIRSFRLFNAAARKDVKEMAALTSEMEALADGARVTDRFLVLESQFQLACARGDHEAAHAIGPGLVDAATRTGMIHIEVLGLLEWSYALAKLGFRGELSRCLVSVRRLIDDTCLAHFAVDVRLLETYAELRHGVMETGRRMLAETLAYAREIDFTYANQIRASMILSELLAEAYGRGIEPEYVRNVIRRFKILPPSPTPETWPWPIRIFTLGKFEVLKDDEPVEFKGKAPKKVLHLLKAIIAAGAIEVPIHELVEIIWPDEEGDAGYDAFTVTLSRLRKLLGTQETLRVNAEKVSLDPDLCWIDTRAFERLMDEAVEQQASTLDVAKRLLDCYRGNFLADETDAAWVLRPRLRMRTQFLRLLEGVGRKLEEAGDWSRAMECYQRGLEADDLAEELYQGLMRCHAAQGRVAEGVAVFRRLRQTLSVVLGVAPSPASEALARRLRDQSPARHLNGERI